MHLTKEEKNKLKQSLIDIRFFILNRRSLMLTKEEKNKLKQSLIDYGNSLGFNVDDRKDTLRFFVPDYKKDTEEVKKILHEEN